MLTSELGDDGRAVLKAASDGARLGAGRALRDEGMAIEGIARRLRNAAKWRSLPSWFGPWWQPAQLHTRWSRLGVWLRALEYLRDAGRPDPGEVLLDGTFIRAHQRATGAKGSA